MSGAVCGHPDPRNAENEPCSLQAGHGKGVPHSWLGQPCRHFSTRTSDDGTVCNVCGHTLPRKAPE